MTNPVRAFRDRYVASFAGVSYDLAPRAVGLAPDVLAEAPDLEGRTVLVSRESGRGRSLVRRPTFFVVALTRLMADALARASAGGVVFSSFDLDDPGAEDVLGGLHEGESVFLNASVDRLPDTEIRRPSFG